MITEEVANPEKESLILMLDNNRETDGHKPKTLEDQLKAYGESSKYKEV